MNTIELGTAILHLKKKINITWSKTFFLLWIFGMFLRIRLIISVNITAVLWYLPRNPVEISWCLIVSVNVAAVLRFLPRKPVEISFCEDATAVPYMQGQRRIVAKVLRPVAVYINPASSRDGTRTHHIFTMIATVSIVGF